MIVAADEVTTTASSCGPACSRAEFRRVIVPDTAGITTSSYVCRLKLIGEAV